MISSPTGRTIFQAIESARDIGDRGFTFVDEKGQETFRSFQDTLRESMRLGTAIQQLKIRRRDRVALIIPDHQSFVGAFLASLLAGAVPTPIYPPSSLLKVDAWLETTTAILESAQPTAILTVEWIRPLLWTRAASIGARLVTLPELSADREIQIPDHIDFDDVAFLQFTSGSTGRPRGVMVTHRNIAENCAGIMGEFLGSTADDIGVSWLPLYHDMGLIGFLFAPVFARRPAILLSSLGFVKRPSLWFELIHKHRATITFAPNFGYALAARRITTEDLARWDLSCLRVAGCGGEPIAADTLRSFANRFAQAGLRRDALLPCYGMAEATLVVTYTGIGTDWRCDRVDAERFRDNAVATSTKSESEFLEFVGCGRPISRHSVRIIDEEGRVVPERVIGEIEFSGPSVTAGYFGNPEATADAYRQECLRTGDLGYISQGELFVTGRKKDLIIIRGRKYAPQVLEWLVGGLKGIRAGAVVAFGRAGRSGTEDLVIVCEAATSNAAAIETEVRSCISEQLALLVGDVVILRPGTLPKTSSGKLQRSKTRQMYVEGTLRRMANEKRPTQFDRLLLKLRLRCRSIVGRLRYELRNSKNEKAR